MSVVGTLRAASLLYILLSALILCVRKQNIRVVVIISRKERKERRVLVSLLFTLTLEMSQFHYDRRTQRQGGLLDEATIPI